MEAGLYIFNEAEDFLQFMEDLQEHYLNNTDGAKEIDV